MRRVLVALALLAPFVAVGPLMPASGMSSTWTASAKGTVPCVGSGGASCLYWTGTVKAVHDGDTIDVDVAGDGTATPQRVRLLGIQAMEIRVYSSDPAKRTGECSAEPATVRLQKLLSAAGNKVRLKARSASSTATGARALRSVEVYSGGAWRDVGTTLVREGHALWQSMGYEYFRNAANNLAQHQARAAGANLWNADRCRADVWKPANLAVEVNWDADGTDGTSNLNGEWARIRNNGSTDVGIGGWWFRESGYRGTYGHGFTFPAGTVVRAGGSVFVHAGSGSNTATHFYWGLSASPFENVTGGAAALGDGGFVFDRYGNLRASTMWPCVLNCGDALAGAVAVSAEPAGYAEYVDVRNTSSAGIDLDGYVIDSYPDIYAFTQPTPVPAGGTLRLYVNGARSDDTALTKHWGRASGKTIFNNSGDRVTLRTHTNVKIACADWGSVSC